MITKLKTLKSILVCLIIIVIGVGAWFFFRNSNLDFGFEETRIDETANQITEIKKIGQWEFLTVDCEVLVDTIRPRHWPLTDDRLAKIYKGSLRLGVNLENLSGNWIERQGDSIVIITLPKIALLDDRFIDEANTTTFYEEGKWDASSKEEMYNRAAAQMRSFALTENHYDMAQKQAQIRFTALFKGLGFKDVNVNFSK